MPTPIRFGTVGTNPSSGGRQGVDNQRLSRVPAARIQLPQGRFTSGGNSLRSPRSPQIQPRSTVGMAFLRQRPPQAPQAPPPKQTFQPRFPTSSPLRQQSSPFSFGGGFSGINLTQPGNFQRFRQTSPFMSNNLVRFG